LKHSKILLNACEEYLKYIEGGSCQQKYFSYDFDFLKNKKWSLMGELLVEGNLRELTNLMNSWQQNHYQWKAWNRVLQSKDQMIAWDIRAEFVESMVHESLLMPSRIRDTIASVATTSLHQIRLSVDLSYKDYLEGDPETPDQKPLYLSRQKKEKRLSKLAKYWSQSETFLNALKQLNHTQYIEETYNYRNLASHFISPNFEMGETNIVTRSVVQTKKLVPSTDNSYVEKPVLGKMSVSYGVGGTPALNLEETQVRNYEQYSLARDCYMLYRKLLEDTIFEIEEVTGEN